MTGTSPGANLVSKAIVNILFIVEQTLLDSALSDSPQGGIAFKHSVFHPNTGPVVRKRLLSFSHQKKVHSIVILHRYFKPPNVCPLKLQK